jgi:hypothetical protein
VAQQAIGGGRLERRRERLDRSERMRCIVGRCVERHGISVRELRPPEVDLAIEGAAAGGGCQVAGPVRERAAFVGQFVGPARAARLAGGPQIVEEHPP